MKQLLSKLTVFSILLTIAFTSNCFAGWVSAGFSDEPVEDILIIDEASWTGQDVVPQGPSNPFRFYIDRTFAPSVISLYDSTQRLYVDYVDSSLIGSTIYFLSDNEEILKVAEDGRLIPIKEGVATITAAVLDPMNGGWLYDNLSIKVIDLRVEADDTSIAVLPGETAVLSVNAIPALGRYPRYSWFRLDPETNERISIITTNEYFLIIENVTEAMTIGCEVWDGTYPGGLKVYFYINIINLDMAYPAGDADFYGYINADQDGNATLEVHVVARDPETISYHWESPFGQWLEEAGNTNILEVSGITSPTEYYCLVTDEYGNFQSIYFTVYPYGTETSDGTIDIEDCDAPVLQFEKMTNLFRD